MNTLAAPFAGLGRGASNFAGGIGRWGEHAWDTVRALPKVSIWGRLLLGQMARVGVESVPIAVFIATFTGIVMALQASYTFTGAIPLYFVGTLVGKTMILELGPVLTGLALAGRVGANIAAELGTMRVTEQIDALVTLSTNPFKYLVAPRIVAGTLMLPCLVFVGDIIGVFGGFIIGTQRLDFNIISYLKNTQQYLEIIDVTSGLVKAAAFGFIISLMGCYHGYNSRGGAQGVGTATTNAVVSAFVVILIANYFITEIFFAQ